MHPMNPTTPREFARGARLSDAWQTGYQAGYFSADAVLPELPSYGRSVFSDREGHVVLSPDNVHEVAESLAHEAEENGRQFAPFDQLASGFNRARNPDQLWEAYDAGVAAGIAARIAIWTPPAVTWRLSACNFAGMQLQGDTGLERTEARRQVAKLLRLRRRQGYPVTTLRPGRAWEVEEPAGCVMVPDACGIISLRAEV